VGSKSAVSDSHSWNPAGTYLVRVKAKDTHKNESDWSAPCTMVVVSKSPPPDSVKLVDVPANVIVSIPQYFQIQGWDPDSLDSLSYFCRFIGLQYDTSGTTVFVDSIQQAVSSLYPNGAIGQVSFTFQDTGTYVVVPIAIDEHGSISDWGTPCTGKINPPSPPTTPTVQFFDNYTVYLPQTPYRFLATRTSLGEGETFEFAWGDGDTSANILPATGISSDYKALISHAYEVNLPAQDRDITVRVADKWGQFSPASSAQRLTITKNFIREWKIDFLDTTAYAYGIAISGDSVYVVDNFNHEIKIFHPVLAGLVGSIGTNVLVSPMYIAVDSEFIYVTDAYSSWEKANKVYKFTKNGALVTSWGGYGRLRGQFDFPTGIACDSAYVYVMDHNNERIQKFTKDGIYVTDNYCPKSRGMTFDGDKLYVASNTENCIWVFNTSLIKTTTIGSKGSDDKQLLSPQALSIFNDALYVVEAGNARVQKLTKSGTFITRWGCEGGKPGQFKNPFGIAVDNNGDIYVVDTGNRRVQKFDGSLSGK